MSIVGAVGQLMRGEGPVPGEPVLYGGGEMSIVSSPRQRATTVSSDTSISAMAAGVWNPNFNAAVNTMILSGDDMYFGGFFTTVGGIDRNRAACVDSDPTEENPTVRDWNPNCDNSVRILLLNGAHMYLGGSFKEVRGDVRNGAACVASDSSMADPTLRDWDPDCNDQVRVLVLSGAVMYLGGHFNTVRGGTTRNNAACVDSNPHAANPTLRAWNPNCGSSVYSMILNGADMYLGGLFTTVRGQGRGRAACVASDPAQANPTLRPWNPNCNTFVFAMILNGADMYLGGIFSTVGGQSRSCAACVDSNTAVTDPTLRAWNPNCNSGVDTMLLSGADMYLGGTFTTVRGQPRIRLACVDIDPDEADPALRAWRSFANAAVLVMIPSGGYMYIAGAFVYLGIVQEADRAFAAPLISNSSATALFPWNPGCQIDRVWSLVLNGDDMYIGGSFTSVQDITRNRAACVDSDPANETPALRAWNPNCNGEVRPMLLVGGDMYLGGEFTNIGGTDRSRVACIDNDPDEASPALRVWNPNCSDTVMVIILQGEDMYLSGWFTTIGAYSRNRAACVDPDPTQASPAVREWNPNSNSGVLAMILNGDDMYLGGWFTQVGGQVRNRAACVDSDPTQASPVVRAWNPNCNSVVLKMLLNGDDMYLAGGFWTVRGGTTRRRAACVASDSTQTDPDLRAWHPNCNEIVRALLLDGGEMYLGGDFTTVSGYSRLRVAAVDSDPDTNFLLDFLPDLNLGLDASVWWLTASEGGS